MFSCYFFIPFKNKTSSGVFMSYKTGALAKNEFIVSDSMWVNGFEMSECLHFPFNPIWDGGGGQKAHPLPVLPLSLLQKMEKVPPNFWLLVLTILPHWCKILRPYLVTVPNYLTSTKKSIAQ